MKKSALTENNRRVLVIKEREQRWHFFEYMDQGNRRSNESSSEIRGIVDIFASPFSRETREKRSQTSAEAVAAAASRSRFDERIAWNDRDRALSPPLRPTTPLLTPFLLFLPV